MNNMVDLNSLVPAFAVLCDPEHRSGFKHFATAWHLGDGDWVSVWTEDRDVPSSLQLISVDGRDVAAISDCELEQGVLGFKSFQAPSALVPAKDYELHKRDALSVIGYPSVIDHPAFSLHRGSLSAERYVPYLCPWTLDSHLALFSADDGYITGQYYRGMQGAPVLNLHQQVVGIILDGTMEPSVPPLTRFRRLA